MGSLKRFADLPRADQLLFLKTVFLVGMIRAALAVFPFRVALRFALRTPRKPKRTYPLSRLTWAVTAASRYVPRATCLPQALAGHALLAQSGYKSHVEIGVAKDGLSGFEAHAWLVCGDQVVLGGPPVERYTSLVACEPGQ